MNLITDQWIRAKLKDGQIAFLSPGEIIGDKNNPPVALAINDPTLEMSATLILIGLMQAAYPDISEDDWDDMLRSPDSVKLHAQLTQTFVNDKSIALFDETVFMQDQALAASDQGRDDLQMVPIVCLPCDSIGVNAKTKASDFFTRYDEEFGLCPTCALLNLYAKNTFDSNGGQGHWTCACQEDHVSIVLQGKTLWETIWLNVLYEYCSTLKEYGNASLSGTEAKFPWAKYEDYTCRNKPNKANAQDPAVNRTILQNAIHPVQVYWTMPRRYLLDVASRKHGRCSMCGQESLLYSNFYRQSHGAKYIDFKHPLCPMIGYPIKADKKGNTKVQPDRMYTGKNAGLSYKDWLAVVGKNKGIRYDSKGLEQYHVISPPTCDRVAKEAVSMRAFCTVTSGKKFVDVLEHTMPCASTGLSYMGNNALLMDAAKMANAAMNVIDSATRNLNGAFARDPGDKKSREQYAKLVQHMANNFWNNTETKFYATIAELSALVPGSGGAHASRLRLLRRWMHKIESEATRLYMQHVQDNIKGAFVLRAVKNLKFLEVAIKQEAENLVK